MNTYTNVIHPKKEAHRTASNSLLHNTAIVTILLVLVTTVAIAVYIASRQAVATENGLAVPYSNALEMQYARPWLEARDRPVVAYSNALELQYAQPWLDAQNKSVAVYSNALEMQYAQPWIDAQNKPSVTFGNALEMLYAQPWLEKVERPIVVAGNAQEINCSSSMEMLYACRAGYGLP